MQGIAPPERMERKLSIRAGSPLGGSPLLSRRVRTNSSASFEAGRSMELRTIIGQREAAAGALRV